MKSTPGIYCTILLSMLLLSMKSDGGKKEQLCHRWIQYAIKADLASPIKSVDESMAKDITFKADGTYQETMYEGQMKNTGTWYLNEDETKMEFMLSSLNGTSVPPFPETSRHFNIIILKLTADTLIYGNEFYRGKVNEPMVYNHSDLYFVRKDR